MKITIRLALAVMAFAGWLGAASAASQITGIVASGPGLGSFNDLLIDNQGRILTLDKTFDSLNPITLTFTVEHGTGPGNPFAVTEAITNKTGLTWFDFHFDIVEPDPPNGVVFTSHNQSTLTGFTLDQSSGPRNLNFTGTLLDGGITNAGFNLNIPDPGANNTFTFDLVQTPTIPEPGTWALMVAGLLVVGSIVRRRV